MSTRMTRRGFTLIELLVVIAIIAILIALMIPAVQKVRESGARITCQNNMKQIALGINNFHNINKTFPTYQGIYPDVNGSTLQTANPYSVYGSWIVHILPYIDQEPLYKSIAADVTEFTNKGTMTMTAGGTLIKPAVQGYWAPPPTYSPYIPPTYNAWNASNPTLQWVSTINGNGYVVTVQQWQPPKVVDPGTGTGGVPDYSKSVLYPGSEAVWGPPGPPTANGYVGLWNPKYRAIPINPLRCPSDPSYGASKSAHDGLVYTDTLNPYSATNYVANWNALSVPQPLANGLGYMAKPQTISDITDGASNTIMLSEAYAFCEGRGRIAFLAWNKGDGGLPTTINGVLTDGLHNFGLTNAMNPATVTITYPACNWVVTNAPNGQSTPIIDPNNPTLYQLNFYYQIRPDPVATKSNNGCNSMAVQTGHSVLSIAMVDGSVHSIATGFDPDMWAAMMLPNDGRKGNLE